MWNYDDPIYKRAIEVFGKEDQLTVTIEEMAELTQKLAKYLAGRNKSRDPILEEYVDVMIMLEQLRELFEFTPEEIESVRRYKLERLERRLARKENKNGS